MNQDQYRNLLWVIARLFGDSGSSMDFKTNKLDNIIKLVYEHMSYEYNFNELILQNMTRNITIDLDHPCVSTCTYHAKMTFGEIEITFYNNYEGSIGVTILNLNSKWSHVLMYEHEGEEEIAEDICEGYSCLL